MSKLQILCDVDGVLCDLLTEWLNSYADAGGERLYASDIPEYNWENYVADKQLFLRILKSGGIFASAKPLPGALEGLRLLREQHEVTLVTTVFGSRAMDNRRGWLFRYVRPDIQTPDIIFTGKKHMVSGDALIEDAPKNLDKWLAAHPSGRGFLVNHGYNAAYSHSRVTRVASVFEAAKLIAER